MRLAPSHAALWTLLPTLFAIRAAEPIECPVRVGVALPELLDLSKEPVDILLPKDPRDPAQVEAARRAWLPRIANYRHISELMLKLPAEEHRLPLLLAASQALRAENPEQRLYLAYQKGAPAFWNEAAWGALQGGILTPEDLGPDHSRWRDLLISAQAQLPGRAWTLWLPVDPGPQASLLMGDGGHLVVPEGGASAALAKHIPDGYTDVEGGLGDLTLRDPSSARPALRWRYAVHPAGWNPAELPKDRHEVAVTARKAYDAHALLAKMRARQLRDRSALESVESTMDVDLHVQSERGQGTDLGFTFRSFDRLGEQEEELQEQVRFNGVRANIKGEVQLPIVESRTSLAAPVALGLTERYRYQDGGPAEPGQRWIRFEPVAADALLFQGQLKVDEATGRILEERSARSGLPGIVKSEQRTLVYGEPAARLWRVMKIETFERWVTAGGVAQVRRVIRYRDFRINEPDFLDRRAAARGSNATMLKQTVDGARYYTRQSDGTRQVETRPKSSGSGLGGGLFVDPRMTFPAIPFAGLAYFNYNALDRNIQVSGLTAGVFNHGSVSIPNIGFGVDLSSNASVMLMPSAQRVVRNGRLMDREAVDWSGGSGRVALGRDLGAGFRLEASGTFGYDHYRNTQDKDHKTEGFAPPPSGVQNGWQGSLGWQWRGFNLRGFYGENHRPDGTFGTQDALQTIANGGRTSIWGGVAGYDKQLDSRWQIHGELGHESAKGVDRFLELSDEAHAVGMLSLPVADRLDFAQIGVTLPPTPLLRLSMSLNHSRMRAVDDAKCYGFTGLTLSGDLPGFWWFTTVRVDLQGGLHSDIPGNRSLRGYVMFLKVF